MILKYLFRHNSPFGAAVKTFVIGTASLLVLLFFVLQVDAREGRVKVVASIFPAYDFARSVGGDQIELMQLLPPGVEAHGFSPTPRDIIRINQADVFLYTGSVMEPRVARLIRSLDGNVQVVDLSMIGDDPHVWTDPLKAKLMVEQIRAAFVRADPAHEKLYIRRSAAYSKALLQLDAEIRRGLGHCSQHTIISGGHFAFGHFIKRYGLQALSAYPGFSPDGKPSPRDITTLIKTMGKIGATAVYHEELLNPRVARILVEETGAQLFLLHAAHNVSKKEMAAGVTYISIMQDNLQRLRDGLVCR